MHTPRPLICAAAAWRSTHARQSEISEPVPWQPAILRGTTKPRNERPAATLFVLLFGGAARGNEAFRALDGFPRKPSDASAPYTEEASMIESYAVLFGFAVGVLFMALMGAA